ncbi:MAG: B12-binding domain-containing radical SAM protein, partial [Cellulosilyticaceae bacterium]
AMCLLSYKTCYNENTIHKEKGRNSLKTLLVSINAKFIHSSLALRCIKAYCEEYTDNLEILELTINHDENQLIEAIYKKQPEVIGFSCYIWNMSVIKTLIPTLKKILPHTTIILGGPEVSYDNEEFFEMLPIDLIMEGEGEDTWKRYLDYRIKGIGTLEDVPSILYRQDGQLVRTTMQKPIPMDDIPFVYDDMSELAHRIIYYEASRGCPFRCQYCLSSVEKGVRFLSIERVKKELQFFLDQKVPQVKFVDRTFNASKAYAMAIWAYIIANDNGVTNFHFEIAAERLDDEMIGLLADARAGLIQFEIGVQSTNVEVLEIIQRMMPFEAIKEVTQKVEALGVIHQHLDLIAGLPLEDYQSFRKSFNDVISLRPEQFQLGFLKLLRGSGLRRDAEKYGIVYKDEPPYEVLYTKHVSYDELMKLHQIEEMLERYYNSERFHGTMEYLYTLFETPFDCYEALAHYWEDSGLGQLSHKKDAYYIQLANFGMQVDGCNKVLIRELVRWDWYHHELVKEMPEALVTVETSAYKEQNNKWIRDDEWINQHLGYSHELTSRQRLRRMHIEYFYYEIAQIIETQQYEKATVLEAPQAILFDYTQPKTVAVYQVRACD